MIDRRSFLASTAAFCFAPLASLKSDPLDTEAIDDLAEAFMEKFKEEKWKTIRERHVTFQGQLLVFRPRLMGTFSDLQ